MELQKQDTELFNYFLNKTLFNGKDSGKYGISANTILELIVRPECNQKCEYCYIYKYGNDLYPKENRVPYETTISNIKILMDYLYKNYCFVKNIEIFAGDLFYDNMIFDVYDILFDYYKKIYDNYPNFFELEKSKDGNRNAIFSTTKEKFSVVMPCNFSFCHDLEKVKKLKDYYYKFQSINTNIILSWSHDGPYGNVREYTELDDTYYDTVFSLLEEFGWGAHPMISYETIDYAIENYKWWVYQNEKHFPNRLDFMPPMLEVRNDGWTSESIKKYEAFLEYVLMDRLKRCQNDPSLLARNIFCSEDYLKKYDYTFSCGKPFSMDPLRLSYRGKRDNRMSCTLGHGLVINCANLSFVPCHRLAYPQFEGGYFEFNEDKTEIVGIQAKESVNAYYNQIFTNVNYKPKCITCENKHFCLGQCNGASFEYSQEPFIPVPSVCDLLNAKVNYLVKRYHELGLFHYLLQNDDYGPRGDAKDGYIDLLKAKGYNDYEQYRI